MKLTIRQFLIDVCGIFLGVSLSSSIEELIKDFSPLALGAFIIVIFLSINFFFAKVKQLTEEDEVITLFGFFCHILTLSCFAAMSFSLNRYMLFMATHVGMRISDILLILNHNQWEKNNIEKIEKRWLNFDGIYICILVIFIIIPISISIEIRMFLENIFVYAYLVMSVFEAIFDFVINKNEYGLVLKEKDTNKDESMPR